MASEKQKIIDYFEKQLYIGLEALQFYETPIQDLKDKSPAEIESFILRHDIYELKRHIAVVKML